MTGGSKNDLLKLIPFWDYITPIDTISDLNDDYNIEFPLYTNNKPTLAQNIKYTANVIATSPAVQKIGTIVTSGKDALVNHIIETKNCIFNTEPLIPIATPIPNTPSPTPLPPAPLPAPLPAPSAPAPSAPSPSPSAPSAPSPSPSAPLPAPSLPAPSLPVPLASPSPSTPAPLPAPLQVPSTPPRKPFPVISSSSG